MFQDTKDHVRSNKDYNKIYSLLLQKEFNNIVLIKPATQVFRRTKDHVHSNKDYHKICELLLQKEFNNIVLTEL